MTHEGRATAAIDLVAHVEVTDEEPAALAIDKLAEWPYGAFEQPSSIIKSFLHKMAVDDWVRSTAGGLGEMPQMMNCCRLTDQAVSSTYGPVDSVQLRWTWTPLVLAVLVIPRRS